MRRTVTCKKCGWVHMALPKSEIGHDNFTSGTSIRDYLKCFRCGGSYLNFRNAKENDCPSGCTIQPILEFNEMFGLGE